MGDFAPLGIIAIVILIGIGAIVFFAGRSTKQEIRSTTRLSPTKIELVVKDNKVDTVFVYTIP